jgi:hypothetical protein
LSDFPGPAADVDDDESNSEQGAIVYKTVSPKPLFPAPTAAEEVTHHDRVREYLAKLLVWLLGGVLLCGIAIAAFGGLWGVVQEDARALLQLFFTAMVTLVSTVVGFYFGSEHKRSKSEDRNL